MIGRPPVLPDAEGLARLIRRHKKDNCPIHGCTGHKHTYQEIAIGFGVSKSAVYQAMRKSGLTKAGSRTDHTDTIPWTLKTEDRYKLTAEILRLLGRVRRGDMSIPPEKQRMLMRWLTERIENHEVVDYDPETGWRLVPWEPGDADVIRPPDDAGPEVYTDPRDQEIWAMTHLSPSRRRERIAQRQRKAGVSQLSEGWVLRRDLG